MGVAYYNEHDPKAAAWLRELIKQEHIAPGVVDERSIEDVIPDELREFAQCHFFAGIGVWSYALRKAGWPDERPIWTGSCPCQPFSAAGKGKGFADERHLWPAFFHLIEALKPQYVIGEQVASKDGLAWFDLVQNDLEGAHYAVGAIDTCAAGFGAPHGRQRLYWLADSECVGRRQHGRFDFTSRALSSPIGEKSSLGIGSGSEVCILGHADRARHEQRARFKRYDGAPDKSTEWQAAVETSLVRGFWSGAEWVECREPKGTFYRPVEPGTFPLADGAPARVGRLRGYGNALNAAQAEGFIAALLEIERDTQYADITDLI